MEWIIPCSTHNRYEFDVFEHFNNYSMVDWTRKNNVNVGDIVYIYVGEPYYKIMFKTICTISIVPAEKIDDYVPEEYRWNDYDEFIHGKYTRLELLQTIDTEELSLNTLTTLDLIKYRIQSAIKSESKTKTFSYINQIFDKYFLNNDYSDDELENIRRMADEDKIDYETIKKEAQRTGIIRNTGEERPIRNPHAAALALKNSGHKCEFNPKDKTFLRPNGTPYTELHHLIPISKYKDFEYSVDIPENIVSLCSYCHNLLHYGRVDDKKDILKSLYQKRYKKLTKAGLYVTFDKLVEYYTV